MEINSKYIRDGFSDYNDEALHQKILKYIDEGHFDRIMTVKVKSVLDDIFRTHGNIVTSYPADTVKILSTLDPESMVKVYTHLSDGWGCMYEDHQIIEILYEQKSISTSKTF